MTIKLLVPDIGDFEKVEVIELLVKEGQEIKKNDPVVTIESDKSSVEIPSTFSGKIESIKVKVGDKVSKGDLILNISSSNQSSSTSKIIPKDTENLIQEAENALKKTQEHKPHIKNPDQGFLSSANQHPSDNNYPYYLSETFWPSFRAIKINQESIKINEKSMKSN